MRAVTQFAAQRHAAGDSLLARQATSIRRAMTARTRVRQAASAEWRQRRQTCAALHCGQKLLARFFDRPSLGEVCNRASILTFSRSFMSSIPCRTAAKQPSGSGGSTRRMSAAAQRSELGIGSTLLARHQVPLTILLQLKKPPSRKGWAALATKRCIGRTLQTGCSLAFGADLRRPLAHFDRLQSSSSSWCFQRCLWCLCL